MQALAGARSNHRKSSAVFFEVIHLFPGWSYKIFFLLLADNVLSVCTRPLSLFTGDNESLFELKEHLPEATTGCIVSCVSTRIQSTEPKFQ